eukprot:TRINITY_DN5982_c0_g1_i5.p1 TRINITY_DN5982_c0_g1~~TRINITY_DN5982_c0_g1_i5.p1  ORF type:complete len:320 (+),score=51.75 TRINITY_DN5982_c0_g1_i5:272-1231(+)
MGLGLSKGRITELNNLEDLSTTDTPSCIKLRKRDISDFPPPLLSEIGVNINLKNNLTILNLSRNKIEKLPDELFVCVNLVELNVSHNQLKVVPDSLTYNLYQLHTLDLSHNQIGELPWEWVNMISLRHLNFKSNQLEFLPPPIGLLLLQVLNLEGNRLDPIYLQLHPIETLLRHIRTQKVIPNDYIKKRKQSKSLIRQIVGSVNKTPKMLVFRYLLREKEGVQDLLQFMRSEHSYENLLFIMAVIKFQLLYPSHHPIKSSQLQEDAQNIFDAFVSDNSRFMINLCSELQLGSLLLFSPPFQHPFSSLSCSPSSSLCQSM